MRKRNVCLIDPPITKGRSAMWLAYAIHSVVPPSGPQGLNIQIRCLPTVDGGGAPTQPPELVSALGLPHRTPGIHLENISGFPTPMMEGPHRRDHIVVPTVRLPHHMVRIYLGYTLLPTEYYQGKKRTIRQKSFHQLDLFSDILTQTGRLFFLY